MDSLTATQRAHWLAVRDLPTGVYCAARNAIPGYLALPSSVKQALQAERRKRRNVQAARDSRRRRESMCGAESPPPRPPPRPLGVRLLFVNPETMLLFAHDGLSMRMAVSADTFIP